MTRGRLTEASIALVRDGARIDQVVSDYVTLKNAGGGSLKGLCPFHNEKSPSFHVTPARGRWHCFGCSEGGDAIDFLQRIDGLDFMGAVTLLADRFAITLDYDTTGPGTDDGPRIPRTRLLAANSAAVDFYTTQLNTSPEADLARRYLTDRGFDRDAATTYECGYSPNTWDSLITHLTGLGFTRDELVESGLVSESKRGIIDRFRGRLMFPIRDQSGRPIGFGARKLLDDDTDQGPKYLNTPETPLYRKSKVLFGLDKARRPIATQRTVVVVEGYTDVMACHLSGIDTAVATCGTAFGDEHVQIIRRLLRDDTAGAQVIYTFDGDSAGQKAALRAFMLDHTMQTHTWVAVGADGMDPCEIRTAHGPTAVADLIAAKMPLFEFALRTTLNGHDTTTPEGRTNAVTAVVPILASMKSPALLDGYLRRVAQWTGGISTDQLARMVSSHRPTPGTSPYDQTDQPLRRPTQTQTTTPDGPTGAPARTIDPSLITDQEPPPEDPDDPGHSEWVDPADQVDDQVAPGPGGPGDHARPDTTAHPNQVDVLKVVIQDHTLVQLARADVKAGYFTHPTYRALWDHVTTVHDQLTTPPSSQAAWIQNLLTATTSPVLAAVIDELAVAPFRARSGLTREAAGRAFLSLAEESVHYWLRVYEQRAAGGDPTVWDPIARLHALREELRTRAALTDGTRL